MSDYHIPVMPKESIKLLNIQKNHWYIDCNLGGGGHTAEILKLGGKVIGIDLDPDAINEVSKNYNLTVEEKDTSLRAFSENLILCQSNFSQIDEVVRTIIYCHPELGSGSSNLMNNHEVNVNTRTRKMPKPAFGEARLWRQVRHDKNEEFKISGILFDLGVSTYQLEKSSRGFSFNKDAPLDMRMDPTQGASAKDLVNGLYEKELAELFLTYGEENFARPIAKRIVEYREKKPIETTDELAKIVLSVRHRNRSDRTHPATRIFQALRIIVNDELNALKEALPKAFNILEPGGRLVVISFHSLEDRIVKNYFRDWEKEGKVKILTDKPIETGEEETTKNPRSRSAKLRSAEKI